MSESTLKAFAAASHIPASLIRAVVRQHATWAEFKDSARDIASYGADCGWAGFTYSKDTVAFTKRNKAAILELAKSMADDLGSDNVYSFVAGFNCLGLGSDDVAEAIHNHRSEHRTAVFNALAWFALEEVARSYVDQCEG